MRKEFLLKGFSSVLIVALTIFGTNITSFALTKDDYLGIYDQSKNFGVANDFNVFVFGDMTKGGADAEGRVAVGGNATISDYSIGSRLSLSTTRADLIVGGNLNLDKVSLNKGNIVIGKNSNVINYANVWKNNGVQQVEPFKEDVIDFAIAKTYLTNASTSWGAITTNASAKVESWGELILEGNDSNLNVFNFDGTNIEGSGKSLSNISGLTIKVPVDSSTIINVSGAHIVFGSYQMFLKDLAGTTLDNPSHILWNFREATDILTNTIQGSVLAPYADLKILNSGHIAGNVMVSSFTAPNTSSFETHIETNSHESCLFNGVLPAINTAIVDSTVSPASATFYKENTKQADINVTMDLKGNTLTEIKNGSVTLVAGTDYTVSGNVVTLTKSYLESLPDGSGTLTFVFNQGANATLALTIVKAPVVTPVILNSTVDPTATFYKENTKQADINVTMDLKGNTLTEIKNGSVTLIVGTDYTVSGNVVTLTKGYLATLPDGVAPLTFVFNQGDNATLALTIVKAPVVTPVILNSTVDPTATFYKENTKQADIIVTMDLKGNTLTEIKNGSVALILGTDYTVSGNVVTLTKGYLATLPDGVAPLTFVFNQGDNATLALTTLASPTIVTPSNPVIGTSPTIISESNPQSNIELPKTSNNIVPLIFVVFGMIISLLVCSLLLKKKTI